MTMISNKKIESVRIVLYIALFLAVLLLILAFWLDNGLFVFLAILLLIIPVPILGIIVQILSIKEEKLRYSKKTTQISDATDTNHDLDQSEHKSHRRNRVIVFAIILFHSAVLFLGSVVVLKNATAYLYTPPALTSQNLEVYGKCIDFIQKNIDSHYFRLSRWAFINVDGYSYDLTYTIDDADITNAFSESEILGMKALCKMLDDAHCQEVQLINGMVIFLKYKNWILSDRPGVLYSIEGKNPNTQNDIRINKYKPFYAITGNWYYSRRLMVGGLRKLELSVVPKALIDHSMKADVVTGLNRKEKGTL